MTFSDAEIAELKSKIPAQYKPAPEAGGLISIAFQNGNAAGVLRTPDTVLQDSENSSDPLFSDKARAWAGLAFLNNPGASASFILTGAQAAQAAIETEAEKDKKTWDWIIQDQLTRALNQRLAELDAELAAIDLRLDQIRLRRAEIGDSLEAIDDLTALIAKGKLDPNNPAHAALLRRAGLTPEDAKRKDLADLVNQRRAALSGENGTLESEQSGLLAHREKVQSDKDNLSAALDDINKAKTPEEKEQAEAKARDLLGDERLESTIGNGRAADQKVAAGFYNQSDEFDLTDLGATASSQAASLPKP